MKRADTFFRFVAAMIKKERLPVIFLAMFCLLSGLWSGLIRIGWNFPVVSIAAHHGAIMVGGFLGTLIALEKLIPLKNRFLFVVPVLSGVSIVFFLIGSSQVAFILLLVASFSLSCIFAYYLFRHRDLQYIIMLIGSICWFVGNALLFTKKFYPLSFPWWLGFILFIIIGERLEISKFLPVTKIQKSVVLIFLFVYLVSCFFSFHGVGNIFSGVALIGVSVWLLRYDVISISISKDSLTRYVAVALLCGYVALMLCGVFFITMQGSLFAYDAVVHTFFLGFAFSMIFAHGPIILPGVLGISIKPYSTLFYLWLALLQFSWMARVYCDVVLLNEWKQYTGIVSVVAILGYFISLAILTGRMYRGKVV